MPHSKRAALALLALVSVFLFGTFTSGGVAAKNGISGVIPTTLTISENSELTGDVQCLQTDKQPCIKFGRSGIKLELNGYTITGTANEPPRSNCVTDSEFPTNQADGIHSTFDEVKIEGPGMVQRMKRHGIALFGKATDPVEDARVREVISNQNCFSGVWLTFVNDSLVDKVVSVRNSAASNFRPCGGVCVTNSNDNRVRRSEFAGNGTIALGPPPGPIPNDFGVGLVGFSSGNVIEENGIGGNINGLALFPLGAATPTGNLIRKNVIAGNPPIEVSADNPGINPVGADIRDFSVAGSNTFEENLCVTYTGGASPPPCPNIPKFSGHKNG